MTVANRRSQRAAVNADRAAEQTHGVNTFTDARAFDRERREIIASLYRYRTRLEGSGFQSRVTVAIEALEEIG